MPSDSLPILEGTFRRECRSLAQYLSEGWPWSESQQRPAQELVQTIQADERRWAEQLAELIERRGGVPRPGNYPTEFTDTHFLALEFMLGRLERALSRTLLELKQDLDRLNDDAEVKELLERMIERKRGQIEAITKLRAAGASQTGVAHQQQ